MLNVHLKNKVSIYRWDGGVGVDGDLGQELKISSKKISQAEKNFYKYSSELKKTSSMLKSF